jgi:glycosyltransferase involved in cell wall biosynthesis
MENKKINVLVVPSDRFGVGFYRSVNPHTYLDKLYGNEFEVEINYTPNYEDLESFKKYDIIHIHKGLIQNMDIMWNFIDYCKANNIVTVMDIDDNWEVGPQHPLYQSHKRLGLDKLIVENLKRFDYVTTTTHIFANKIKKYNKNVLVFPNAIDPTDEQYSSVKNPSNKIRFGFVMGSAHEKDMEQFKGVFNSLPQEVKEKMQVVLCGFDLRGTITMVDKDGKPVSQRPITPTESVWYKYEQTCTHNYSLCSEDYKTFLNNFVKDVQWPLIDNEFYRREWTKDITEFAKHYRNLDVLFAPLDCNSFNEVKSELKFIEAGFTRTAVIATNYGPYTIGSKNMMEFGGELNQEGNCILIDDRKKHKDWRKAIIKLVNNPELIKVLQDNMYEHVKDKYDIRNVTKDRAEWYKVIIKK